MKPLSLTAAALLFLACGPPPAVCTPWCHAVHRGETQCGGDGCGGWCGDCRVGERCVVDGTPARGICEEPGL